MLRELLTSLKVDDIALNKYLEEDDCTTAVVQSYTVLRRLSLFPWQSKLVQAIKMISLSLKKDLVITMRTGYGKTPLIAVIAKTLALTTARPVYVCTMSQYLTNVAFQYYSFQEDSNHGSCMSSEKLITYLNLEDLNELRDEELAVSTVIFDEID